MAVGTYLYLVTMVLGEIKVNLVLASSTIAGIINQSPNQIRRNTTLFSLAQRRSINLYYPSYEVLVFRINKPLSGRVVLAYSSPQKVEFLMYNWSFTPVEARADNDRSRVYLSHIPSTLAISHLVSPCLDLPLCQACHRLLSQAEILKSICT